MATDRNLQQLADDLAAATGWEQLPSMNSMEPSSGPWRNADGRTSVDHPFPIGDINPIAAAWPEGDWYLEVSCYMSTPGGKRWSAYAGAEYEDGEETRTVFVDDQWTEWEARARLLRAVLKETTDG